MAKSVTCWVCFGTGEAVARFEGGPEGVEIVKRPCPACKPGPEPAQRGEYGTAEAFYASEEWLSIVRVSLDDHRQCLATAKRIGNPEQIKFYEFQIKACEQHLNIAPAPKAQASLF